MRSRWMTALVAFTSALATANPIHPVSGDPEDRPSGRSLEHEHLIKLSIGLHPQSHEHFEQALYNISNPRNPSYGHHLTREQAKALLQPSEEASSSVKRWLRDLGVSSDLVEDDGLWLHAHLPADQAEALQGTGISKRSAEGASTSKVYLAPEELRHYISSIYLPTPFARAVEITKRSNMHVPNSKHESSGDIFWKSERETKEDVDLEKCKTELTPPCIRKIYRVDDGHAAPHPKSRYGVVGFNGQTAQFSELEEFLARFAPYAVGANFSVELANGGKNPQGEYPSGEANLDIQYALAMAYDVPVQYISFGGEYRDFIPDLDIADPKEAYVEPYLEFANYLLDLPDAKLPQVVSISYGINEQVLPESYARQVCDIFGQLGTRGVSVVVAGGNTGPGPSCQANDGTNTTRFLPMFPASCPYVTAVGGVLASDPGMAWNESSGGFSNYFDRPEYQSEVVDSYLDNHGEEWKGYYNPAGRGTPDVAAFSWGYQVMNHGEVETTGGTSAATPVFGALIARINNDRFHEGKPAMGFLNPWLYSIRDVAFTDIKKGKSIGCTGTSWWDLPSPFVPNAGWSAVEGWDPITGLGTPLYDRLHSLAPCL